MATFLHGSTRPHSRERRFDQPYVSALRPRGATYARGRIPWRVGKAVRLIRVGRFRDAAALAENHGVAEPCAESIDELCRMFPTPATCRRPVRPPPPPPLSDLS